MNKQEAGKLIYAMTALYPGHFNKYHKADYEPMAAAWSAVLADIPYCEAEQALKEYARTDTGFPPTTGQICRIVAKIRKHNDTLRYMAAAGLIEKMELNG